MENVDTERAWLSFLLRIREIVKPKTKTQILGEIVLLIEMNSDATVLFSAIQLCQSRNISYQLAFLSEPVEWIKS